MKKITAIFIIVFTVHFCAAQGVAFSHDTIAYTRIAGGQALAPDSVWDEPVDEWRRVDKVRRLNFTFKAFGVNIDTFMVADGYISSMDGSIFIGNVSDLCDRGFGGTTPRSPITIHRMGTSPNRIVVLQWSNHGFYADFDVNGTCKDSGNMQLWIYETGNKIELRFGKSGFADYASTMDGFTMFVAGMDNGVNQYGIALTGDGNNPDTVQVGGTEPQMLSYPAAGKRYTFNFNVPLTGIKKIQIKQDPIWCTGNTIYAAGQQPFTYSVLNSMAQPVCTGEASDGSAELKNMAPGIYFLDAKVNGNIVRKKIVIQ